MGKFSRLGNDLYTGRKSIDFVGKTRIWYAISGLIIVAAVLGLYFKGLNFGLEFRGGAQFTVSMPSGQVTQDNADKLRDDVAGTGIAAAQQVVVTTAGKNSIIIETEPLTPDGGQRDRRRDRAVGRGHEGRHLHRRDRAELGQGGRQDDRRSGCASSWSWSP